LKILGQKQSVRHGEVAGRSFKRQANQNHSALVVIRCSRNFIFELNQSLSIVYRRTRRRISVRKTGMSKDYNHTIPHQPTHH